MKKVVVLALVIVGFWACDPLPNDGPPDYGSVDNIITIKAWGDASSAYIRYYLDPVYPDSSFKGDSILTNTIVSLPWEKSFIVDDAMYNYYIEVQRIGSGAMGCGVYNEFYGPVDWDYAGHFLSVSVSGTIKNGNP